jgi:superfamily I DNA/RNA helicase
MALEVLFEASKGDGIRDLNGFNKWINKFFDEDVNGCVTLSTVHKAKGLEAENVFILDVSKMPHPMAKTESQKIQELNLKYVALTRSKSYLGFVAAKPRY